MPASLLGRRVWLNWLLAVIFFSPLVWMLVHIARGGMDPPPPMWTETDLVPLPDPSENAWEAIGPSGEIPRALVDLEKARASAELAASSATVSAELARPEVVALVQQAQQVLGRTRFADPHCLNWDKRDPVRIGRWFDWIELSTLATMQSDPESAARSLSSIFRLAVDCANTARTVLDYRICALIAEKDLARMSELLEVSKGRGSGEPARLLEAALREIPALSIENALMGEYVQDYALMTSELEEHMWFLVDRRATFREFDDAFMMAPERRCEKLIALKTPPILYQMLSYNALGNHLLRGVGTLDCDHYPPIRTIEKSVAAQRQGLRDQLGSN